MEQPPPLPVEPVESPAPAPEMSLPARLLNIFAVPSEVFLEVRRTAKRASNWLVPMTLLGFVSAIAAILVLNQPAIIQKIREQQSKAIDEKVQAGKMTREQADKVSEITDKYMTPQIMATFGVIGGFVGSAVKIVWWGFVLWLMAQWGLKVKVPFSKTMEVAGLVMMVVVLGAIVSLLLTINLSKLGASPGLSLMLQDIDFTRRDHAAMGAANIFNFWQVALMALGLARLTGAMFARAALLVFGYWIVQESVLILLKMGQMAQ